MERGSNAKTKGRGLLGNNKQSASNGERYRHRDDAFALGARDLLSGLRALNRGEFAARLPDHYSGVAGDICTAFNELAARHQALERELAEMRSAVGREGRLRRRVPGGEASGGWGRYASSVNGMLEDVAQHCEDMSRVATAVTAGDLSCEIDEHGAEVALQGDFLRNARAVNGMVRQLRRFGLEVRRVAYEVGVEGQLGAQANSFGLNGDWKETTDGVNLMAANLTAQVREIGRVTTAVAQGDLTKKVAIEVRGEVLEVKKTINTMVDQLSTFADEVSRVAREVGTEGTLGGQAHVRGVSGVWSELTQNVNSMANNLTLQVRNVAEVAKAIADGDLSKKISVEAQGEMLGLKNTINTMVDQLSSFADEVTRVAREVGTEGMLGGQAKVQGVAGRWRDLTENVNSMATNLTDQVRNISEVTSAIAAGDLSRKISVDARGEMMQLKRTINTTVDKLNHFSEEVSRVARLVGTEGTLGVQANVRDVSGIWKELTDNVNFMALNLTNQVRNITEVTTAVARGDLSKKITVPVKGELLQLKNTINDMVEQLSAMAFEVTRVAREVGTEGKLGGQAEVLGTQGTWKELTDNVNLMAANLTDQVRDIAEVATAIAHGDLNSKITVEARGELFELKNTVNTMVDQLSTFAEQVVRVAREVGVEGKLGGQAEVRDIQGTWKELTDNVNLMADNLTNQVRDIANVTTAVAMGDLSRTISVEVRGEMLELKNTINTMVGQLRSFAGEVTRVAREVGTDGVLGGQARVEGVSGTWRELTDNVNIMALNLTEQVRGIARVVTAVANGNLREQLKLSAKGEIATLVETINDMIVTLSVFADQVSGVARDVGAEGILGGQADVPGAAGIWRDLTNNVNELAGNLTRQVRAIGDVATAVAKGDLTRLIDVEARGEVALLKDNINQMIHALAETTQVNQEQDWLKTNLARFSRMLQGQRDLTTVAEQVLSELAPVVGARHGTLYLAKRGDEDIYLELFASYAFTQRKRLANRYELGEGLVGQAGRERKRILLTNVPPDYIRISSSLGEATPYHIVVVPILFEGEIKGVIELAAFHPYSETKLTLLEQLTEVLGVVVATIEATMRTDELLRQSQSMAEELQTQQEELQQTNEELEEKARQLTTQRDEVERKNKEVELARQQLEDKAEQLSMTSKYKSQFLANMSHELRTPLNSMLILSRQLSDNRTGNLQPKEVEYASTIHQAGSDLLSLINEILDLAKIESGTMAIEVGEVLLDDLRDYLQRSFAHLVATKGLEFEVVMGADLPTAMLTDDMRLRQVLRNLLANALKFTDRGHIRVAIEVCRQREWSIDQATLNEADCVIAFRVEDSGIGIPVDKQAIVFEAFQQVDGGSARRHGGTGLGLSISREIASLLGGELQLQSVMDEGSTFTLLVPREIPAQRMQSSPPISTVDRGRTGTTGPAWAMQRVEADLARALLPANSMGRVVDDRSDIQHGDRVLLVIEDDRIFAELLVDISRERGFKCIVAPDGETALSLARQFKPDAISLDLMLPDMDGWVLLDRLKHDSLTRHIPVHIISAAAEERRGREFGAVAVLVKPVDRDALDTALVELQAFLDRRIKRVLIVEDDEVQRAAVLDLIGDGNEEVESLAVGNAEGALQALAEGMYDCMVLDLALPGMGGLELLRTMKERGHLRRLPVIVYTGKELSREEQKGLSELAQTVIVKDVRSPERLLEETSLLLHRAESSFPEAKRKMLRSLVHGDPALRHKKVLVVDDDMRNVFALTAVLEQHEIEVIYAENGQEALDQLQQHPEVDGVLMDIMMPEMDGYEAMRRIRAMPQHQDLPMIALTAKAMKGDRQKCIEAGASDYVTKPVDTDQLVSLLRVWLYR